MNNINMYILRMYPSRIAYWVLSLNQSVGVALDLQKEREKERENAIYLPLKP
jgi:hypothetical protein